MRLARRVGNSWAVPAGARAYARSRRSWRLALTAIVLGLLLITSTALPQQRPRLVVYLHSSIKSRALENALSNRMPSVDVTVYGRYRDFARELDRHPDAALALAPVLSEHSLSVDLQGTRAGQDSEPYVLLSIGSTLEKSQFSKLTIGAVDLLGRERTARFVASLLGIPAARELKYVIKSEDLLPLLQFKSSDAVILAEEEAKRITELSKLDLRVTRLSARVGLAAISFRSEAGWRVIRPSIQGLDLETNRKIGVEAWR